MSNPIRPKSLDEFIGQQQVKKSLRVFLDSARSRQQSLDHTLFYGPPGLGKTTLSSIIAYELCVHVKHITGPSLERVADLAAILIGLSKGDVLFIDEIHRLPKANEEVLYSAMEDFKLPIVAGGGRSAHTIVIDLNPFTLIGATTRFGLISPPLRDRFGIVYHLELYSPDELKEIILRDSKILGINIDDDAALILGKRARGVPRIAIQLLRRVRDFAEVRNNAVITKDIVEETCKDLHIDSFGLNDLDRKYLGNLVEKFKGGPVGSTTLATACGEDRGTLEDIIEPYLMKINFLLRTPKGRIATRKAKQYLNIKDEDSLFY